MRCLDRGNVSVGLALGAVIQLPGGSPAVILHGAGLLAVTAVMSIILVMPFGFFASLGRGYLLPDRDRSPDGDPGQPGRHARLGGIFPLVGARPAFPGCAHRPLQLWARGPDWPGRGGRDVSVVEIRRPEQVESS